MSRGRPVRYRLSFVSGVAFVALIAVTAAAQSPAPPADSNPGKLTITGSFDAVSTYMFRGIRQHSTGIALWPVADLGAAVYSGNGGLKSAGINVARNSCTQVKPRRGPTGKCDRSDFTRPWVSRCGGVRSPTTTRYTAEQCVTTVKEIMFKLGSTQRVPGPAALTRTGVAFEFAPSKASGGAGGGGKRGEVSRARRRPGFADRMLAHRAVSRDRPPTTRAQHRHACRNRLRQ